MAILGQIVAVLASSILVHCQDVKDYGPCLTSSLRDNDVCDSYLEPSERARALVAAMTIEEKLANLVDHSLGAERIGLPKYNWWNEALHGVAHSPGVEFAKSGEFSSATSFPSPITISAAFDDDLVEKVGLAIGAEARAFANAGRAGLSFWTPNINPFKDPRWGRGLETPGEDPLRISHYVERLLKGMEWASQEDDNLGRQVIATCKHYAAYDLERWNGVVRYSFDAVVSMQDLVEYYLPPFKQCARDSNVGSIMCSYNRVNGTPACASEYLMQTVLREHWNWTQHDNFIVSDCNAVHNIYADHKWVKTAAQAVGAAMTAGTDNTCEAGGWGTDVVGAFNQSLLTEKVIDQALTRQYEGLIRANYFFTSGREGEITGFPAYGWDYVNTETADSLARASATDGLVLLKNDGTLPVKLGKNQTVAVIGMWANDTSYRMLGNYYGTPPIYSTPLLAAQQLGLKVNYADAPVSSNANYTAALEAAKQSDIIFYFGGIDGSIENEDRDRTTITWPSVQLSLLRDLSALGKKLVVVQLGTSIDNTPLLSDKNVNSILWAGYPGMHGGLAAFDIITGAKAPAGRLPITQYPANYTNQVPMTDMALRPSAQNPGRTYKWYNKAVQEFGFGLHYTNFTIRFGAPYDVRSSANRNANATTFHATSLLAECTEVHADLCPFPRIPIVVTNTGSTTSDFVALAFLTSTVGPAPHPIKELASYKRVRGIKPGEQREVELQMKWGDLARVNERGDTVLYGGRYCLGVDVPERVRLCFEVVGGEETVLDRWPQPQPKGGNGTVVGRV
ncbi:glycosyl hydrolase family 3 N terminal domain-containing protein [Massariosphaeria phaeospora]|uniref:xylan 1,4-beta-xylosidase n=1 Tax=Massariosphaeria phaeospora TaxID=100035 RepID=A0A7C8MHQ6_9PLEO|nr:glycosyl hydrolase family 3 N terminal domain-containing protein [Massariosphaeria phaeospora]